MRRIFLAALPAILFIGALMALNGNAPAQPRAAPPPAPPAYTPPSEGLPPSVSNAPLPAASGETAPAQPGTASLPPSPPPAKQVVLVSVRECSDGSGTTAYEYDGKTQVRPAGGRSAQCAAPVAVIEDGKRYFGCADGGKIILDCDWFVQRIGAENQGQNAVFGSSNLEDFSAPDVSGFSCADGMVDKDLLLGPNGTICDLQTLVGNVVQAHGG